MALVTRLEQQVDTAREEAAHDPLTGVANRRRLEAQAASLLATEDEFSVVIIDLDHFKDINDTFGHLVGDEVLKAVVERCRRAVRDSDLVTRFAGDEFVLLLPGSSQEVALRVAARVTQHLSSHPVQTQRGPVAVSASIGIATRRAGDLTFEALLERADRAMYEMKARMRSLRDAQSPKGPPAP